MGGVVVVESWLLSAVDTLRAASQSSDTPPHLRDLTASYTTVDSLRSNPYLSTGNHVVVREGDWWVKTSRDTTDSGVEIVREAAALQLLGTPHHLEHVANGGVVLYTKHLGDPLPVKPTVAGMVDQLGAVWRVGERVAAAGGDGVVRLPGIETLPATVRARIGSRLAGSVDGERLMRTLHGLVPSDERLMSVFGACPRGLLHTDPHSGNWVVDGRGRLRLLDWESAVFGPRDYDLVCLAHYLLVVEGDVVGFREVAGACDPRFFGVLFWLKAASTASWVAWKQGVPAGYRRVELLQDYVPPVR